jgi:hypothetical protein
MSPGQLVRLRLVADIVCPLGNCVGEYFVFGDVSVTIQTHGRHREPRRVHSATEQVTVCHNVALVVRRSPIYSGSVFASRLTPTIRVPCAAARRARGLVAEQAHAVPAPMAAIGHRPPADPPRVSVLDASGSDSTYSGIETELALFEPTRVCLAWRCRPPITTAGRGTHPRPLSPAPPTRTREITGCGGHPPRAQAGIPSHRRACFGAGWGRDPGGPPGVLCPVGAVPFAGVVTLLDPGILCGR